MNENLSLLSDPLLLMCLKAFNSANDFREKFKENQTRSPKINKFKLECVLIDCDRSSGDMAFPANSVSCSLANDKKKIEIQDFNVQTAIVKA